jgi:hypothetical protein
VSYNLCFAFLSVKVYDAGLDFHHNFYSTKHFYSSLNVNWFLGDFWNKKLCFCENSQTRKARFWESFPCSSGPGKMPIGRFLYQKSLLLGKLPDKNSVLLGDL